MSFQWPFLLLAVGLVPVGWLVARAIDARRRARLSGLGGLGRTTTDAPAARSHKFAGRVPAILVIGAFVLFAVALGRPEATVSLPRIEGTLMLTFDVSGSMAAADAAPSRLEVAKTAAKAIVAAQPVGVVVGVVAFSDAGLTVQAASSDQVTVDRAIDRLTPTRGTSVGQGILAALAAITVAESDTPAGYYSNRSAEPTATPEPVAPGSHDGAAIVLLSDGENNERPDPASAAGAAADRGVRVLTIGVGTTAGATLELDGFRVQTSLDEAALQQVADLTAGTYQPVADVDPARVYDQLTRHLVVRDEALELTAIIAGAGLLLLVGGLFVSFVRTGRLP